jgi:membrane protein DedA with SNARE-associated domain
MKVLDLILLKIKFQRKSQVPHWLQSLLANYGYWAVFLGLFLNNAGLPVPGNTLLLGAGYLVGEGTLSLWGLVSAATAGCFMGTNLGYWIGRGFGLHLLENIHWLRLTHKRIMYMEHFFKRYGAKGVFFARFVTLVHPVIGLFAGMGKAPVRSFLFYNLAGSAIYALLYTLVGDYFGQRWGFARIWKFHTTLFILLLIIILVVMSLFWRHSIHTFFGRPFFRRKRKGFWGK